jgi:hypothetical protein
MYSIALAQCRFVRVMCGFGVAMERQKDMLLVFFSLAEEEE